MAATRGMTGKDPHIEAREDMCQFADDRLSNATKLAFVHEILQRHIGEARLNLDRIQRLTASLDERTRKTPAVAQALEDIARDDAARERFLDYAHAPRSRRCACACSTSRTTWAGCRKASGAKSCA